MRKESLKFDSRDGSSKIYAVKWIPEEEPKAILQITHGMAEYIDRYENFANYLAEHGFLVVGDDHLGHGRTASMNESPFGYIAPKHGDVVLVRDEHRLKKTIQAEYPSLPYFVLGHSMGSFIIRNYMYRYGTGINGAIVMGTGMQPKAMVNASKVMAGINRILGDKHVANFLNAVAFGAYNKKIPNPPTQSAWLTRDVGIQEKYVNDPYCGFVFTVNGFRVLLSLIANLHKEENVSKMPKDLPVLITSGEMDPVGNYGKDPKLVYDSYIKMGMNDVTLKLYPDDRHEILNELDKEQVFADILAWLEAHL